MFSKIQKLVWANKTSLQEHYFRMSLREVGIKWGSIKINHHEGKCWHKKTGWVPIVFPSQMIELIGKLSNKKTTDYFFRGVISDSRSWIRNYSNVSNSTYGRNKATKYDFDINYYSNLKSARFGLSPTGECPWSYRFFESIMCNALPIIGDDENDIFCNAFHYLRDSDKHYYEPVQCEKNLALLIKMHTLNHLLK